MSFILGINGDRPITSKPDSQYRWMILFLNCVLLFGSYYAGIILGSNLFYFYFILGDIPSGILYSLHIFVLLYSYQVSGSITIFKFVIYLLHSIVGYVYG